MVAFSCKCTQEVSAEATEADLHQLLCFDTALSERGSIRSVGSAPEPVVLALLVSALVRGQLGLHQQRPGLCQLVVQLPGILN